MANDNSTNNATDQQKKEAGQIALPSIGLPKGGGSIKGIEEKFQVNAVSGTCSFSIPIPFSPSRNGFTPAVGLNYNSGSGNSPFGLGWDAAIPAIARKTEKQLPQYHDEEASDTFILSGTEDLVPLLVKQGDQWIRYARQTAENGTMYTVTRYRPRIEGLFSIIERWKENDTGYVHWRTVSRDNIHSFYGLTPESRIGDPHNAKKIFKWLLCKTHDDKGNITLYLYKKEDFAGIPSRLSEKNKEGNCTQTYIKKILYGNKHPYYPGDAIPQENDFLFKVIFDYGEHDAGFPIPKDIDQEKNTWKCRKDTFSSFRPGFEIRTYRRCSRVLVFHCFDAPDLPHSPYLVKSLDISYDDALPLAGNHSDVEGFSFLVGARQNGHVWDDAANAYSTKHLPDLEMVYQPHAWNTKVQKVSSDSAAHAPAGLADRRYLWIDLFSEGISGMLSEQANGWFYKSNLGNGNFSGARIVAPKPSSRGLASGSVAIQELEGNGVKCLVQYDNEPRGFFKLLPEEEWEAFQPFESFPNIDTVDPNMRSLDLDGDGMADLMFTEENVMRWYPGLGEKGFEVSRTVTKAVDEEKGPAIVFENRTQSIFLADMSGDGLTDIVRIKNGEVCYWPNLGYGHFGAKVSMDNAPLFDLTGHFNPAYLRLADIDGSGTIDIVYLGKNDFRVWMNRNGNAWTEGPQIIPAFPGIHNLADVSVLDFLGSGTACIVYSSALSQEAQQPLQYIDLMSDSKPGLLTGYVNNCGKEVSIEYRSSTHFYLEDRQAGRAWITKLPFPVHCLSKTRVEDKIRETVFTSSYRYRHGYFDHSEREFRGFARVDQLDTDAFSQFKVNPAKNVVEETLHQPPVRTVSWFHTGAYLGNKKILHQCASEYFSHDDFAEYDLPEPAFDDDLSLQELKEAYRACKGLLLRTEIYAEDGTGRSAYPYSASQSSAEIRRVQPRGPNRHASFLPVPSESIAYGYERNPADPRIAHSYVLEIDELGNITKSASVIYPRVRRPAAPHEIPDKVWDEQNRLHVTYGEAYFTNDIVTDEVYRLRAGYESKAYEVSGIIQPPEFYISKQRLADDIAAAAEILFEEAFTAGLEKRLTGHSRAYFLKDDMSGPQALGQLSELGIGYKSYRLAFTKNLVSKYFGTKVTDVMFKDAKYEHSEDDEHWWVHSGTVIYAVDPRSNFYNPLGARDVFGNESSVEYDSHTLLVKKVTDAIGNTVSSLNDYRTLSPVQITDPNLNRSAVETDALGLVVKSAVMGKEGDGEGDTLADPTARMEYDLLNWQHNKKPNYVHTFDRERHGAANPRWQESYVYSDGGGSVIMTKAQAEAGKAKKWNVATGTVQEVQADPRWIGNGRTIVNNKGNPVKQYDPYFSDTPEYESEDALVETGVTPIIHYDPVGRNIRTDFPDGTFSKIEFDAWFFKSFDLNDTVKESRWYAERGSPDPAVTPEPSDAQRRAAWLSAKHDDTPGTTHSDSLGRNFYAVTDYGGGKTTAVYSERDPAGRYAKMYDQAGRKVSESYTNMIGAVIYGKTAEKGEQWVLTDVMGRPVKVWDNDLREVWSTFDPLHRPVSTFVKENGEETLFGHVVYGERFPEAEAVRRNLKGQAYQLYDQAGVVTLKQVDFKGNVTEVQRQFAKEYKQLIDWQPLEGETTVPDIEATAASLLENEVFSSSSAFDALNRPVMVTLPDKSVVEPKYNEANVLDSLRVKIRGEGDFVTFLENQEYDARGQRQFAKYGNGLVSNYSYDPKTFRLINLVTKKTGALDVQSLQNLHYTFDPVGNIVYAADDAQQTHFFKNAVVKPESTYEYDATYQLLTATGREHAALGNNTQRGHSDLPSVPQLPHSNDEHAVRRYTERYKYDDCGNITLMHHEGQWKRHYRYEYQDDPANSTNRLKSNSLPGDDEAGPYSATYQYDSHGNMTKMPHLGDMVWNFMDQLTMVDLLGGGLAFYVFGLGGRRMRKIIERTNGKKTECIYLGAVEIYREYRNGAKKLERSTLHVSDDTGRIAQVDTKLLDDDDADLANPLNANLIRYQYTNHLGSATLETDQDGSVISYEEYHPYGTSAYRSSKSGVDLSLKRYRFSGKERDDETGLYYFGARFYAAWLGRWTSSDPAGFVSGFNLFRYCSNNPIMFHDPNGMNDVRAPSNTPQNVVDALRTNTDEARTTIANYLTGKIFEGNQEYVPGSIRWNAARGQNWAQFRTVGTGTSTASEADAQAPASEGGGAPVLPPRQLIQPGPVPASPTPAVPIPKIDLPQAPPGTTAADHARIAAAAQRAARNADTATYAPGNGVQANHGIKWRAGRDANLDPRIPNDPRRIFPLQSRKANVLNNPGQYPDFHQTNPDGSTTYTGRTAPNGRTYNTPHTYADDGYEPYQRQLQQRRYGRFATDRVIIARAGRATQREMTGSPGPRLPYIIGPTIISGAGNFALTATRTFVPGVVEAEIGFATASTYAYAYGYATAGAAFETAAAYTPLVAGSAVAGAAAGHFVEGVARDMGASEGGGIAAGVIASAATGAAVGALIGSVVPVAGNVIGAGVGAAVGAVAGLGAYLITRFW